MENLTKKMVVLLIVTSKIVVFTHANSCTYDKNFKKISNVVVMHVNSCTHDKNNEHMWKI